MPRGARPRGRAPHRALSPNALAIDPPTLARHDQDAFGHPPYRTDRSLVSRHALGNAARERTAEVPVASAERSSTPNGRAKAQPDGGSPTGQNEPMRAI